jgi:hypothetical protein
VGAPLMAVGRYRDRNGRRWVLISRMGRPRSSEPVGYPPPMGGGEASRQWRQPSGAHGGGVGESWRKGTRWGWARWAAIFCWAEKAGGPECR